MVPLSLCLQQQIMEVLFKGVSAGLHLIKVVDVFLNPPLHKSIHPVNVLDQFS